MRRVVHYTGKEDVVLDGQIQGELNDSCDISGAGAGVDAQSIK